MTLRDGEDFDHLVLAAAMGAYKPLTDSENGDVDPGFCHELAEANPAFADFLTIPLSPTLALQIWSDKTLEELGWIGGKCATVSGPQPLNIWADMTQVLDVEPKGPKSLHYFCGALSDHALRGEGVARRCPPSGGSGGQGDLPALDERVGARHLSRGGQRR